ncbi:MAG: hypothetical protein H0S85_08795 [Desulfovibrionaceae bacterium]|jgi:hypothetical protein|nr:hypothetical protein [Desulfovibrionaceae bacterium]
MRALRFTALTLFCLTALAVGCSKTPPEALLGHWAAATNATASLYLDKDKATYASETASSTVPFTVLTIDPATKSMLVQFDSEKETQVRRRFSVDPKTGQLYMYFDLAMLDEIKSVVPSAAGLLPPMIYNRVDDKRHP